MSEYTTLYIARHGETEWNIQGRMQGHQDSPLTQEGINQATMLAHELKHIHFDYIFSSDLLRAKRTAEIVKLERNIAVKTTEALREQGFGKYEGSHFTTVQEELKDLFERFKTMSDEERFKHRLDVSAESSEEVIHRTITFLREIAVTYKGKNILMVTHGMVIRLLLTHFGFASYEELSGHTIKNAAYMKLESDGVDFFIKETQGISKRKL